MAAGAAVLAAGACGGNQKASPAPQTPSTVTPDGTPPANDLSRLPDDEFFRALPSNPAKDWDDSAIRAGGTVMRAHNRPGHFDFITTTTGFVLDPTLAVHNRLVRFNAGQGQPSAALAELEGDLASAWERPDDTTIVLTLNPGVRWQNVAPLNGRPFTVDDVRYTFDRGRNYNSSVHKRTFNLFESVDAVGANQVRLKLTAPQPLAELYLAQFQFSLISPELGTNPDTARTKIAGTGPMILDQHLPGQSIRFKRNPDYFKKDARGRPRPYVDGLVVQYFADNETAVDGFAAGKLDVSYSEVSFIGTYPYDAVRDFNRRLPRAVLQLLPYWAPAIAMTAQWAHPAWRDVRFRRALNMLVPREAMAAQLFKGQAIQHPYFPWPVLFETPPAGSQLGPWFRHDIKEARTLLEASGLAGENSYEVEYYANPTVTAFVQLWQEAAARAGLKLDLVKQPDQVSWSSRYLQRQYRDIALWLRGTDFLDAAATATAFVSGQGRNFTGVSDPEFDALYARLMPATGEARKAVARQMWERQLDQVYEVSGIAGHFLHAMHPRLQNFVETSWSARAFGLGQVDAMWIDPARTL